MRKISKIQIVFFILALFSQFGGNVVFNFLANVSATRATQITTLGGNTPTVSDSTKSTNSKPSQPTYGEKVQFANGSYGVLKPINGTITIPPNATVFLSSVATAIAEGSSGGYAQREIIIINPVWFLLENFFEFMQNARNEITLSLLCFVCALELPKRFKSPKLPPIFNR
jgi:hypothetical protein